MRRLAAWLGFSWVLFTAPVARADEEPWRVARAHYARGVELANKAAYRAALDEFNAAYQKSPHFAVLYNIAQAEIALGRPLKAIETLKRYLRDGKDDVPAERRRQVEQQLAELKSAFGELMVKTEPPGATISVDGAEIGNAPLAEPLTLTPGSHVVTASRSNALPVTRVITVKEGEHQELEVPVPLAQGGLLSIQCWELGAQPYLDGKPVELSKGFAGIPVSEGRHTVSFVAPGRVWQEQFVEVPPGVHAAVLCGTVPVDAAQAS
ncbi:MAG TPA: PEGA domain-containing protein, partial [Polyangiaceae bacterium]|nr:PEGA domain-containing protein [Polyangiaceae bacterium]